MRITRVGAAAGGLAIASALVLGGCSAGGGEETEGSNASGIITTNGSEPQNPLVPTNTNEVGGGKIIDNIFAGLVYYDAEGAAINDMAESIETEDNVTFTVKVKEGQKFTNDEDVTAESFVDAWNYGADAANEQLSSYFFEDIQGFSYEESVPELPGLKVVDDQTFTITLNAPRADFPLRLGYSAFYPLPQAAFEDMDAFGENPIGNGPYMLDGEGAWKHNEKIDLVVNPDYEGGRKAQNDGVSIIFYATQEAAYADLQSGNLDIIDQVPDTAYETFEEELGDRAINQPAAVFQSFTIPERLAHFGGEEGKLRRQAISMAINREEITEVIFAGTRTPAHDFTSPVIDGYSEDVPGSEVLDYDPDAAKDLWAQADAISPWDGTFQIAYNADGGHQAWVDAVTNNIKNNLGIDASGAPYPTFAEARTLITDHTIQTAFRTGWQADYPGLFNFLGPLYATNAGSNDGDYSNPEFDRLLQEGSAASSTEEANELFQQAQSILFEDLPAIPLWYSTVQAGFSERVDNVQIDWHSVPLFYQVTVKE